MRKQPQPQSPTLAVTIKRFDLDLPLPEYKTARAAAMDLVARVTTTIAPRTVGMVPLNIALQLPPDHWALLAARSSLFKKGLQLINGIGVGDEDFCGDNDEYQAALFNFTDQPVAVERGERLVQLIIMNRERVTWQEQEHLEGPTRGGFGSTGR